MDIVLESKDFSTKRDFYNKRRHYIAQGYIIKEVTVKKIILYKESKIPVLKKSVIKPPIINLESSLSKQIKTPNKRSVTPTKKGPIIKKEEKHASILKRSDTPPHLKLKKQN